MHEHEKIVMVNYFTWAILSNDFVD